MRDTQLRPGSGTVESNTTSLHTTVGSCVETMAGSWCWSSARITPATGDCSGPFGANLAELMLLFSEIEEAQTHRVLTLPLARFCRHFRHDMHSKAEWGLGRLRIAFMNRGFQGWARAIRRVRYTGTVSYSVVLLSRSAITELRRHWSSSRGPSMYATSKVGQQVLRCLWNRRMTRTRTLHMMTFYAMLCMRRTKRQVCRPMPNLPTCSHSSPRQPHTDHRQCTVPEVSVQAPASAVFPKLLLPILCAAATLCHLYYWAFLEDLPRLVAGRRRCSGIQPSS